MDLIQTLDPSKLVLYGTGLSFILSVCSSPIYNFPLFLFGTYAQENTEAVQPLQTFTGLLGVSTLVDFVWLFRAETNAWVKLLVLLLILLKIPTFFSFANAIRHRGGEFGLNVGGPNLSGPTIWSMPGGFTSSGREGYQNVDEDAFARPTRSHIPAQQTSTTPTPPPPGAYQTV